MFFKRTDHLTQHLTSYDFLKSIAVVFMFIDHIGAFFYPEYMWFRVFGRLGFPAWFFLAGYSKDTTIHPNILVGAVILIIGNIILGQYTFAANALVSFICIRIFMTFWYRKFFANWEILLYATIAFILALYPTNFIFEYGTLAFLLAMCGYAVRNRDTIGVNRAVLSLFMVTVAIILPVSQILVFGFDLWQSLVCGLSMMILFYHLYTFKADEYPHLTAKLPWLVTKLIQFGGRYTLEIYVIHLLLIKAYLFYADVDGRFDWFSPTLTM